MIQVSVLGSFGPGLDAFVLHAVGPGACFCPSVITTLLVIARLLVFTFTTRAA